MKRLLLLAAAVALLAPLGLAPASGHCDPGTQGGTLGLVSTCPLNAPLEERVEQLNAASDGSTAWVLVKDFRFHPEVVTIRSGGTVVFVYADVDWNQQHDPRSSGSCGSQAADLDRCPPSNPGQCFDVVVDDDAFMTFTPQTYPVTFRYDTADGLVEKSRGFRSGTTVGDLTGAQTFRDCPADTSSNTPEQAVLPYHCGVHGDVNTPRKDMRGAIVILA